MTPLMPSLVKGNNVYRPSQGTYGAASAMLTAYADNLPRPGNDMLGMVRD
jgi:hypothetical protein